MDWDKRRTGTSRSQVSWKKSESCAAAIYSGGALVCLQMRAA
jgi:hypothetical protein